MNIWWTVLIWTAVVLGVGVGVAGGLLGTWFSIKNTGTPAERAFMIKCSVATWVFVIAFAMAMYFVSMPYSIGLAGVYITALVLWINWMNRVQARMRSEQQKS